MTKATKTIMCVFKCLKSKNSIILLQTTSTTYHPMDTLNSSSCLSDEQYYYYYSSTHSSEEGSRALHHPQSPTFTEDSCETKSYCTSSSTQEESNSILVDDDLNEDTYDMSIESMSSLNIFKGVDEHKVLNNAHNNQTELRRRRLSYNRESPESK